VFSSANAVDSFMERLLASPLDLRELKGVKICAVGPATAGRLAKYGLKTDVTPAEFRAEALVHAIAEAGNVRGVRILLPHGDIGREIVADELRKQGADVTEVVAYRTVVAEPEREGDEPDIYRMLLERRIDVVTFTSASAVRTFVKTLGPEQAVDLLRTTIVASIGPVTAEAAAQCQIQTTIMPSQYTVPALVAAIVDYFEQARMAEQP
jgi:uroporphyrinogen III methyltransferase/synthase